MYINAGPAQGLRDDSKRARGVVLETRQPVISRTISQMYTERSIVWREVVEPNSWCHPETIFLCFLMTFIYISTCFNRWTVFCRNCRPKWSISRPRASQRISWSWPTANSLYASACCPRRAPKASTILRPFSASFTTCAKSSEKDSRTRPKSTRFKTWSPVSPILTSLTFLLFQLVDSTQNVDGGCSLWEKQNVRKIIISTTSPSSRSNLI